MLTKQKHFLHVHWLLICGLLNARLIIILHLSYMTFVFWVVCSIYFLSCVFHIFHEGQLCFLNQPIKCNPIDSQWWSHNEDDGDGMCYVCLHLWHVLYFDIVTCSIFSCGWGVIYNPQVVDWPSVLQLGVSWLFLLCFFFRR